MTDVSADGLCIRFFCVLRGGGIIFLLGLWIWAFALMCGCLDSSLSSNLSALSSYLWFLLAVSLGFIYVCPQTVLAHWVYLIGAAVVLAVAYVLLTFGRACSRSEMLKSDFGISLA